MLENTEPTDRSESDPSQGDAGAPAKKAARKAPAKRAPRKTAAKQAAGPDAGHTTSAEPTGIQSADSQSTSSSGGTESTAAAEDAKPKRASRPRKAAAKKTADVASVDGEASGPAQSEGSVEADSQAQAEVPATRAPRKRVSKKATPPAAADSGAPASATDSTPAQSDAAEQAAPALIAAPVLFQPPVEAKAPARRRRTSKAAADAPVEPVAEELPETRDAGAPAEFTDAEGDGDPDSEAGEGGRRRRRRGRRGRGSRTGEDAAETTRGGEDADGLNPLADGADEDEPEEDHAEEVAEAALSASARRRRRRRRSTGADGSEAALAEDDPPNTVVHVRDSRGSGSGGAGGRVSAADDDGVRGVKGSTRLEAKRQRRRDNRDSGRKRAPILTEAEFLARREAVDRVMAVRQSGDRTQIAVLEDDILVEHYVTRATASSAVGNVYLGRVQNVLPSMEAAFIDIGRGRNGVLYAGEVNWDSAGLEGKARSIENALNPGDTVLVQVTKDPIGHKGARLTSQVSLPGRFVVYVPGGGMTGISRKLPDVERSRLKAILKKVVPDEAGVIVRTAAEGASEQDLISDVERLKAEWDAISRKAAKNSDGPQLVHGEPDLAIRVVRDIFNDDFKSLIVAGSDTYHTIASYVRDIAPDLADRISLHTVETDLFRDLRVDEQLMKALDRKVWLPSGGSLVIDRTEAMTVVDVNTGKYTGSGGNLEQTVTRNNLEAAEEIVRQLRLRDIGGMVVIDFIDMVLESNRDLVLRRLTECLGRDRTKHQVAEVTSLGLVQMTRKRVGEGLLEAFSEPCEHCKGRGVIVHLDPVEKKSSGSNAAPQGGAEEDRPARGRRSRKAKSEPTVQVPDEAEMAAENDKRRAAASAIAAIAAATSHHEDAPHAALGDAAANGSGNSASGNGASGNGASGNNGAAVNGAAVNGAAVDGAAVNAGAPEQATPAAATTRPRRRRAASRPAGPPVAVTTE